MRFKTLVSLIIVALLVTVVYLVRIYTEGVDIGDRVVTIIIKKGDALSHIAQQLVDEGVVYSRTMLVYPARLMSLDRKLTPGRYDFTGENSCRSVLKKLESADFVRIKVTIPEGASLWEVAALVTEKLPLDSAAFVGLDDDTIFLSRHDIPGLEGFLFPETYFFAWGISEDEAAHEMIEMYSRMTESIWPDSIAGGMSRYDIVKLASIIEAETGLVDERDLVSSVYHNRLRKNMKLDADPTVIYGLRGLKRPLYTKDLRKDTPYNTYLHRGLPPTPINSPGLASIKAALYPAESEYLFFVANESGGHYFSRTNAEHNRAKQRVKDSLR
ncbi:MAG: endolytic transglycosylase MltG [Candidatus Zixiibacteriota bacterium]|nr:MAG: endolytic transglycosylase MltG [candidate division Zixibacteria bacterium]